MIVGAFNVDTNGASSGASFVVFGKSTDTNAIDLSAIELDNNAGGFVINGVSASDEAGFSVSGAGDVNGDGLGDLIVGASGDDPNGDSSGASFVVFGKSDGKAVELSTIQADNGGFVINGVSKNDKSGNSVSSAGDVNGDGFDDLIIGAWGDDPNNNANSGASFVVFGGSFLGSATQVGTTGNDTLTGTENDDVIFSGTGDDTINGSAGNDRVSGGHGADTFVISDDSEAVTIIDFTQSEGDKIDLSAFDIFDFTTVQNSTTDWGVGDHDIKITVDFNTVIYIEDFSAQLLLPDDVILNSNEIIA